MKINKASFKRLVDNLYDGIYFVDRERRIKYWNKEAEKISGLDSDSVIGRRCWDNILRHVNEKGTSLCAKCCPLSRTIADGKVRKTEAYLHHRDGHLVPVLVRLSPIRNAEGHIMGGAVILNDNSAKVAMAERFEECQKMALLDSLTRIANRRYIDMNLHAKLNAMNRYGWPLGVIFIDIDRFKKVNDRYGHHTGDRVLRMVAGTLVTNLRAFDVLGRWGGEEFVGIVVNVNKKGLRTTAERLRMLVESSTLELEGEAVGVTVSIGGTLAKSKDTVDKLLKRVDKLVYASKTAGRNRVTIG